MTSESFRRDTCVGGGPVGRWVGWWWGGSCTVHILPDIWWSLNAPIVRWSPTGQDSEDWFRKNKRAFLWPIIPPSLLTPEIWLGMSYYSKETQESRKLPLKWCILIKWCLPPLGWGGGGRWVCFCWNSPEKEPMHFLRLYNWLTILILDLMFLSDHKIKVELLYNLNASCI